MDITDTVIFTGEVSEVVSVATDLTDQTGLSADGHLDDLTDPTGPTDLLVMVATALSVNMDLSVNMEVSDIKEVTEISDTRDLSVEVTEISDTKDLSEVDSTSRKVAPVPQFASNAPPLETISDPRLVPTTSLAPVPTNAALINASTRAFANLLKISSDNKTTQTKV